MKQRETPTVGRSLSRIRGTVRLNNKVELIKDWVCETTRRPHLGHHIIFVIQGTEPILEQYILYATYCNARLTTSYRLSVCKPVFGSRLLLDTYRARPDGRLIARIQVLRVPLVQYRDSSTSAHRKHVCAVHESRTGGEAGSGKAAAPRSGVVMDWTWVTTTRRSYINRPWQPQGHSGNGVRISNTT
jgi:hypothetical protein